MFGLHFRLHFFLRSIPQAEPSKYSPTATDAQGIKRKASNALDALIACGQRRGGWYLGQCQAWEGCSSCNNS
jgi:hypothetical protein